MNEGYIHIYTGEGKGKTTAAFGLALRAAMADKKVYIGQFVKGMKYSEVDVEKHIPNIKIEQLGRECFIYKDPTLDDIKRAKEGLEKCRKILKEGKYNLVILDEINIALYYNLIEIEDVINMLNERSVDVEVVLTGRYAKKELIEIADLVTNMDEIKHYYKKGVKARKGIES
ncbi:MAG: cob(I)yrinic acid a,c-diamide adenosyltransferase [Firmicutes bacterium]|nr:cob(I)yrinic acid a,c-diamide adenosyltransferase [Bacillota bacterium]